nr:MAG TPA: hypothetical protein [Caudoviricetes sp.]
MSEEKKQQVERIVPSVDALDVNKREAVLAYMQGMAAGARMAEAVKQKEE